MRLSLFAFAISYFKKFSSAYHHVNRFFLKIMDTYTQNVETSPSSASLLQLNIEEGAIKNHHVKFIRRPWSIDCNYVL